LAYILQRGDILLVLLELAAGVSAAVLAFFWIREPAGNWEPWTLVCGLVTAAVEGVRRYINHRSEKRDRRRNESGLGSGSTTVVTPKQHLGRHILDRIHTSPLSELLGDGIELAKLSSNDELERWCRMELYGYGPLGGMRNSDSVPEYRGVSGRWIDGSNQPLDLSEYDDLAVVNNFRFRSNIRELEELGSRTGMQNVLDDHCRQLLRKHIGFEAVRFCFSPVAIVGMLDTIRNLLAEKVKDVLRNDMS
jgi:hypothetical protein